MLLTPPKCRAADGRPAHVRCETQQQQLCLCDGDKLRRGEASPASCSATTGGGHLPRGAPRERAEWPAPCPEGEVGREEGGSSMLLHGLPRWNVEARQW